MKKQTKQLLIFALAILLVIGWAMWPRSLERLILRRYTASDFSTLEWLNVTWTPPNAVDYSFEMYPKWTLDQEQTQQVLEILKKARVNRPVNRGWLLIGDQGNYELRGWFFNIELTQARVVRVWNTNYLLDRRSHAALWEIFSDTNPGM